LINNIGIIGMGNIGRRYLRLLKKFRPELNIVAISGGAGHIGSAFSKAISGYR
jgi:hypothetical protein